MLTVIEQEVSLVKLMMSFIIQVKKVAESLRCQMC